MSVVQLIKTDFSGDTLKCAISLAEKLETGEAIGCVIGILYRRQRYSVDICGEAQRNPTFALGISRVIGHELVTLIQDQGDRNTTL